MTNHGFRNLSISLLVGGGIGALTCATATPAWAQAAQADPQATQAEPAATRPAEAVAQSDGGGIGEIVVTAQKRAENIQDVPISIAAVSGSQLQASGISRVTDIGRMVPGLTQQPATQATNIRLNMRGVGANTATGIEPAVATFLDDVYIPRPGTLIGRFYDIESVEVLRGPQGTLFGRNASAGAMNIHTRKPTDQLEGSVAIEGGSFNTFKGTGILNTPLGETAALRIAADFTTTDGNAKTRVGNKRIGKERIYSGRATLRLEPTDSISWILRADYQRIRGDGAANVEVKPDTVTATGAANFAARLGGVTPDLVDPFDQRNNNFILGFRRDRQFGITSDATLSAGSGFDIRLINAYRDWRTHQLDGDIIFTPIHLVHRDGLYASKSQSHELQIISPKDELLGGKMNFVAGLYYFREKYRSDENFTYTSDFCNRVVQIAAPALYPACVAGPLQDVTLRRYDQTASSIAGYAQADYAVTDTLTFLLGARYTHDKKSGLFDQRIGNNAGRLFRAPELALLKRTDGQFTWRANISYRPQDDLLFFANYSTGFKAGGFNSGGANVVLGQRRQFRPETVKNIELGTKTTLADGHVLLNVTAYRMEVSDLQDYGFDGTSLTVTNAAKLRQQGVELDTILRPVAGLQINGAVAYLDSAFLSYPSASNRPGVAVAPNPGTAPGTQNLKGARATFSPKWQGSVGAQYDQLLGSSGYTLSARGDMSFVSAQNIALTTDNNPQSVQSAYQLVSARLTLTSPDKGWSVSVFGDNVFDKGYCLSIFPQTLDSIFGVRDGRGNTLMRCIPGAPRTFGARAEIKF